ncbi:MAG: hypothetical protein OXF06_09275 [Bacteroidetes bacterium]|nr:hypothetical protein [Bacteroidota bacterium]MCY4225014.1 hypothetical protein [Bacteroidota bacterium]
MRQLFDRDFYGLRILATMITVQVLLLLCVKLWPTSFVPSPPAVVYSDSEVIQMEEVISTQQSKRTPPPPAPLPPVVRSEDIILEDEITLDDDPLIVSMIPVSEPPQEMDGSAQAGVPRSEPPKPIRIVTPDYPRSAQRRKVRAEIIIHVVVNQQGHVQSPKIIERYLISETGNQKTLVNEIGYGLEDAAVNAALKSLFRPAKKDGATIDSHHQLSFRFGM